MASVKKAQVVITANASVAKRVMEELDKAAQRAAQRMKSLAAQGKQNTKEFKEAEKEFQAFNSAMRENVKDTKRVQEVMKNLAGTATRDLRRALQSAKRELDKMSANDPKRQRLIVDMKAIQQQIDKNTVSLKKFGSTHNSVWQTAVRNITAYMGVFAAFNKIKSLIDGVFEANLKLSDSLANIRKVSGLTSEQINQLYNNISKIDTRNTIETLNELAYTGAKLGIGEYGVEGLTGFVKAAEQVQMALGEDMGEKALPELAKMTDVMGLIKQYGVEQSMQKAASAIFQLGATSTATGTNIVEFSKRLYGLANVSRVSTDELLAIASASDAMGLMPEVAATAFNKFFTSIQKKHNLIEKSLDIPQGTINKWFEQGKTMNAVVEILEKMGQKGNMNLLGDIFKDVGGEGARLINVLATMSDRVDILKKHLKTSRDAFKEGEAVIAEYMIQNQTAAALAERAANLWVKAFVNPKGVDMVKEMAQAWYDLSKSMTESDGIMKSLHTSLQFIAETIKVLIYLFPFLIKAAITFGLIASFRAAVSGCVALYQAFRMIKAELAAAAASAKVFSTALNSNAIVAAASAIIAALWLVIDYFDAATEAEERQREEQQELEKAFAKSKEVIENSVKPLETYKKALDNANMSEAQRIQMIKDFKNDYQDYLDYLGIEVNSVYDLAQAYGEVVKIMKIKKAYDEREAYLENVNGDNRMNRIASQAEVIRLAKEEGADIDKSWLAIRQYGGTDELFDQILKKANSKRRGGLVARDDRLWNAIDDYIKSIRAEKTTKRKVYQMYNSEYPELKDFSIEEWNEKIQEARWKRGGSLGNEAVDKKAAAEARAAATKAARERKQALRKELKDAETESQAIIDKISEWYALQEATVEGAVADGKKTREEADRYLKDLKMSKNRTLATARKTMAGKMDKDAWKEIISQAMPDDATVADYWVAFVKEELTRMMSDQGDWSVELAGEIAKTDLMWIHNLLARFNGSAEVMGIRSTASFDKLMKGAAANEREIAKQRAELEEEVKKILLEYQYVEQAEKAFHANLVGLGIMKESYEQYAKRMQEEAKAARERGEETDEETGGWGITKSRHNLSGAEIIAKAPKSPEAQMLTAFLSHGAKPYAVNPQDESELYLWLQNFMSDYAFHEESGIRMNTESWVEKGFPQLKEWVNDMDKYLPDIQKFYFSLIQWEDSYYEAKKKAYDREKKLAESRWRAEGWDAQEKRENLQYEGEESLRKIQGDKHDYWKSGMREYGFADTIADDPEIARIKNRMEWRAKELEDLQSHNASEELIMEKQNEMLKEAAALAEKVSQEVANRISKIQTLSAPLSSWGEEVGQMLGEQWQGISRDGKLTFSQMAKNMGIEYAKLTLKMASENLIKKLQQGLFYKQMEIQEMKHQVEMTNIAIQGALFRQQAQTIAGTTLQGIKEGQDATEIAQEGSKASVMTMFGISEGASKTISALGWWGIPLIGVITSILMGLLNSAKSSANQNSSSSAKTNTKLKSGMLTYDEGNVQSVVGNDGHVYRARQQSMPSGTALVSSPITTTVNGQPALVAERGPEIVIGRRTTRHIMMNEPGLLRHLAQIDRNRSAARYHTFDDGNIGGLPGYSEYSDFSERPNALSADDVRALAAAINIFQQTVTQLQKKGIPAHINKFGTGGLIEEVKSGLKFDQRYNRS